MKVLFRRFTSLGVVLFTFFIFSSPSAVATDVWGTLGSNTQWTLAGSPYNLVDSLTIPAGVTLTIDPGVRIMCNQFKSIEVAGTLTAIGSSGSTIVFDGSTPNVGWWRGLHVYGNGSANLEYCQIKDTGYWNGGGIYKEGSGSLSIRNCLLKNGSGAGLRLTSGSSSVVSENNAFEDHVYGVRLSANTSFSDTTSSFSNNSSASVALDGATHTIDVTWELSPQYSMVMRDTQTVAKGTTLTLKPGLVLKSYQFKSLEIKGQLNAQGTSGSKIYLTSHLDDSVGGDTNNNGDENVPAAGWWRGIHILDTGSATLDYCTVSYGGYWNGGVIYKEGTGDLSISNSTLQHTKGAGLRLTEGSGVFSTANNSFKNNTFGVRLSRNTSFSDTTSTFSNNSTAPVAIDGSTHTSDVSWELSSDFSMVILDPQTIAAGATLTLMPGLVLKSFQFEVLDVEGQLIAEGTAGSPIHLTSHRDDAVGGDANNDGNNTIPTVGWWRGVQIQNEGSATLDHCTISYGGYWNDAGIYKQGTGNLMLTNSTVRKTGGAGLRIREGSGTFITENNRFDDNIYGIRLSANTSFSDTSSTFSNNSTAAVAVDASTHTTDVSWELSPDYSVVILDSQTVAAGATLTLQPGLVLKSIMFKALVVDGQLLAEGTAEAPIHFTSHPDDSVGGDANNNGDENAATSGWWMGIKIQNEGSAVLEHSTISYGGYWNYANLYKLGNGELLIRHSLIRRSSGAGLRLTQGSKSFLSEYNRFEENVDGVRLGLNTSFSDTTSTFTDNTTSQVSADGGTHTMSVDWQLSSLYSIYFSETHTMAAGTTLTLAPGLVIKMRKFKGLVVNGELYALGTAGRPITITDYRDDSVGGDTNNDLAETAPGAGWWSNVQIRDGAAATIENCTIRYSGYWDRAGILKLGTSDLSFVNSTISMINGSALYLSGTSGTTHLLRSRFLQSTIGVQINGVSESIVLNTCHYEGNSDYGVLNNNSSEVDARSNWWGDTSGPFHATLNPEGMGDVVSDGVLFEPWRTSPGFVDILSPTRSGTIVAGDSLRFLGSVQEDPQVGYFWDFDDGRTSNVRNPGLLSWPAVGNFEVQYSILTDGVADPFPEIRELSVVANDGKHPDLRVESLVVPSSIGIGQPLTVDYTVKNLAPVATPADSSWTDRIYLSGDDIFDTSDVQLGSKDIDRVLAPGKTYVESLTLTLPPAEEGAHYLIISVNDDWDLVELHRLNNERPESVNVLVPQLENGVTFEGSHGLGSAEQYFRVTSIGGKHLLVDFDRIDPNLEVYIRFGELPTRSQFDYRLSNSSLIIPAAASGDWYLMVYGDQLSREGNYNLKVTQVDVAVTGVSPNLADSDSMLEINIFGAGFSNPLSVDLVASNGTTYASGSATVESFTSMTATFGGGMLPPDTYDVRVEKNGNQFVLPDAIEMVSGGVPDFYVDVISPTPMGYHQLATVFVEYGNEGTAPMQAPLLIVTALQNERPGALLTLDQTLLSSGFWTSAIPRGFSTSIRLLAGGEKPGVLLPGEHIRIPVYYAGWLKPWDFRYPPFEFKVVALTADDIQPVPWSLLEPTLKPSKLEDDAWSAIWQNTTSAIGPTVGDFVTMLSRNAVYLSKIGSDVRDVNTLLSFEIMKASGVLPPLSRLTTSADMVASSGLINLWFTRSFPRDIANRYRLGPLGYGWSHPWDIALEKMDDGTVIIRNGNGSESVFQPDSRGNKYFSGKGDGASLTRSGDVHILTRRDGNKQVFDSSGLFVKSEDRNGNSIQIQYAAGQLSKLTHSNGRYIELRYNGSGLMSEIEDSLGRVVSYAYNADKHLASYTDSSGRVTTYTYSSSQELQKQHALTEITHPGNQVETYAYDSLGRLASQANGSGTASFSYDQGEIRETASTGEMTSLSFNHLGILSRVVDANSGVTSFSYDDALNNTLIRSPDGSSMSIAYDRNGGISKVTNQNGDTWTYRTGAFGLATQITSPEGRTQSMEYDSTGNLTKLIYPNGLSDSFSYDSNGNMTQQVNALGITETSIYNAAGQPLTKSYSDGSSRSFGYDSKGRLTTATNGEGTTEFEYDSAGYLVKITYPTSLYIEYEYDDQGRITSSSDHNGLTNRYAYNASGLLESLKDAGNEELVAYTYDGNGHVSEKSYSTGARTVYEHNGKGQITLQRTYDPFNALIAEYAIEYSAVGLPLIYQTPDGVYTYAYDQAGRLVETVFDPISESAETTSFQRNKDGHLVKMNVDGIETSFSSNEIGRYTSVDDSSIVYNALGNVSSRNIGGEVSDYVYDAVGNVVEMQTSGGDYTMRYDALGTPLGLSAPGMSVDYLYDRMGTQSVFGEYKAGGEAIRTYQHGLEMSVVHYDGESYFPVYDPLKGGTVLALPTEIAAPKGMAAPPSSPEVYLPFGIPWAYDDPNIPVPEYYGRVLEGYISLAEEAYERGGQAYEWGVNQSGVDKTLGALLRNQTYSNVTGTIGQIYGNLGNLGDLNQYLGRLTNIRVVIEGAPQWFQRGANWLGGDGPNNVLGHLGHIANGIKVIDGLSETWSENRSVDILDVLNPFGSTSRGESKIRDGLASTALTLLGTAAVGTAAAPVAAVAGVVAFLSGITGGLQEDFWIWWDDLDVTGDRLRGSAMSGSRDPNQKLGVSGYGEKNYVSAETVLTYRIDFENHSDATAPAQVVTIRDRLPDEVDWSTFEILDFGFGDISVSVDPDTRFYETVVDYEYKDDEYEFEIEVHVEVSIENGEIYAIFYSIDPETDLPPPVSIGFLPPEPEKDLEATQQGEGRGQGHLTYAVMPQSDIPTDTEIRNVATIQFDFSFDIDTNQVDPLDASKGTDPAKEALVTIDSDLPQAVVEVLPEMNFRDFIVSWGGQSASGLRSYDVYYRIDGGAWTPWLAGTDLTSALFVGEQDKVYEFYAVGTNNVGVGDVYMPAVQASTLTAINELNLVLEMTANRDVTISWIGAADSTYQIQTSSDLTEWDNIGPVHNSGSLEILSFTDESFDALVNRFYRVVVIFP